MLIAQQANGHAESKVSSSLGNSLFQMTLLHNSQCTESVCPFALSWTIQSARKMLKNALHFIHSNTQKKCENHAA